MQHPEFWGALQQRYAAPVPRKMLALDGGGIRGVLSLGILRSIEKTVGTRLCDYFDYIAGTSTGAIIATGLARGMLVDEVIDFYVRTGSGMFQRTRFLERLNSLYRGGPLEQQLKQVFGEHSTLEPNHLKTLLLIVTRNVTTDSPWPVSSNPEARYNIRTRSDSNLGVPLWKLVRASTAAPVFFPPEVIQLDATDDSKTFVFVDGGVTPYNNPAFLLYRFATDPAYRLNWNRGERDLLLISVGTGAAPTLGARPDDPESNLLSTSLGIPAALMHSALVDQDINCRVVGRCTFGDVIDNELLDMVPREGDDSGSVRERWQRPPVPLSTNLGRAFLYARYNVDLSPRGLAALGLSGIDHEHVQRLDNAAPENIELLRQIGEAAGGRVDASHFGPFLGR
jgi:hypothetical protein